MDNRNPSHHHYGESEELNLLHYPSDWFLVPETLQAVKDSAPLLKDFYVSDGKEDPKQTPLHTLIKEPLKETYAIPLFSEVFCRLLVEHCHKLAFKPNADEDELRQIPEIVFSERDPLLYQSLMYVALSALNPVFTALWNRTFASGNVQVANYNPREKKQGAWHHDLSADITVVIPLNTGQYSGGGTEFAGRGIIPPLSNGTALIFPSFTHLHRGLPVTEGDRYLLVFWLKGAADER